MWQYIMNMTIRHEQREEYWAACCLKATKRLGYFTYFISHLSCSQSFCFITMSHKHTRTLAHTHFVSLSHTIAHCLICLTRTHSHNLVLFPFPVLEELKSPLVSVLVSMSAHQFTIVCLFVYFVFLVYECLHLRLAFSLLTEAYILFETFILC